VLDLGSFAVIKIPEDGTLVPKHVGVGTSHELCFMTCLIVLYLVHFLVNIPKRQISFSTGTPRTYSTEFNRSTLST